MFWLRLGLTVCCKNCNLHSIDNIVLIKDQKHNVRRIADNNHMRTEFHLALSEECYSILAVGSASWL